MFAEKYETMRDGCIRSLVVSNLCNRMGPSKIKDFATRAISTASENTSDINP